MQSTCSVGTCLATKSFISKKLISYVLITSFETWLQDSLVGPWGRQRGRGLQGLLHLAWLLYPGRFERYLDFVQALQRVYALPEGNAQELTSQLLEIRSAYFTCPPVQRLSVASQVSFRHLGCMADESTETVTNYQQYLSGQSPLHVQPPGGPGHWWSTTRCIVDTPCLWRRLPQAAAEARRVEEELQAAHDPPGLIVSPVLRSFQC